MHYPIYTMYQEHDQIKDMLHTWTPASIELTVKTHGPCKLQEIGQTYTTELKAYFGFKSHT